MARLTGKEKEILVRAAELVLAGEWPWETGADGHRYSGEHQDREARRLQRAADKLRQHSPKNSSEQP